MPASSKITPIVPQSYGHPHLIFFCDLDGRAMLELFGRPSLIDDLVTNGYGVALAIRDHTPALVAAVRMLNEHGVQVVAWLQIPEREGGWFHLQNYPQAVECYRNFRAWSCEHGLIFHAIGIDIEPPSSELDRIQRWGIRDLARRVWLVHENVLFAAARAAYADLVGEIHHDGYEVHAYQLPILADDRRAGSTVIQRAFDIVGLPADVEVLMCYSSLPINTLGDDIGGALISSYGPTADSIGVGAVGGAADSALDDLPPLSGDSLERDLLLAARHTDLIYVFSLEGCVERGLLPHIIQMNWSLEPHTIRWKRLVVGAIRALILFALLISRFSGRILAWLGWGLFMMMLVRTALRRGEEMRRREGGEVRR
ncbi:MAG: hypothetical protein WCF99_10885 [Chloroflexales bacterium]